MIDGTATARRAEERLGVIAPGSIAGEMALLYDMPRLATVAALTPMRLLVLTVDGFDALLDVAPCIKHYVDRIAAERRAAYPPAVGAAVRTAADVSTKRSFTRSMPAPANYRNAPARAQRRRPRRCS